MKCGFCRWWNTMSHSAQCLRFISAIMNSGNVLPSWISFASALISHALGSMQLPLAVIGSIPSTRVIPQNTMWVIVTGRIVGRWSGTNEVMGAGHWDETTGSVRKWRGTGFVYSESLSMGQLCHPYRGGSCLLRGWSPVLWNICLW